MKYKESFILENGEEYDRVVGDVGGSNNSEDIFLEYENKKYMVTVELATQKPIRKNANAVEVESE